MYRLPDTEPQSEIGGQSITERKKAKLRQWMVAKYKERHALYKAQREHLRSKERAPYQSQHKVNIITIVAVMSQNLKFDFLYIFPSRQKQLLS